MNQQHLKILCQNPQHDSKPIRVVCMKENCDQQSRMGCIDCIKFTNKEHNADLIDYKDIFNQNENKMETSTFPDDQISKEYKSFTNDYGQPLNQDMINEQIERIKIQFLERIEKVRAYLLNKVIEYQNKSQINKEEAKKIFNQVVYLYYQLQQAYTLTPLREILINLNQDKDNGRMNQDLKQFIQNKDRKDQVILLSEKLKQFNKDLDTRYYIILQLLFNRYVQNLYDHCSQQILIFTDLMIHSIQSQSNENIIQNQFGDQDNFKLEKPGFLIFINSTMNNQNNQILQQDQNTYYNFEEWRFMIQRVDKILKGDVKDEKNMLYDLILKLRSVEELKNIQVLMDTIKNPSLQFQQKITQIGDQIIRMTIKKETLLLKQRLFLNQYFLSSSHWQLLQTYIVRKVKTINLLYRATRDGMNAQSFHSKCDNKGPTITIIQSKDHERIFGGFANGNWGSQSAYVADNERKGFLFSLTHKTKHEMIEGTYAIHGSLSHGPLFGEGHDLIISKDFGMDSYSNLGYTYIPIVGAQGSTEAKSHLAGAYNFAVKEMEVFSVEFQ